METCDKEILQSDVLINRFVSFVQQVGIEVKEDHVEGETFVPGLDIRNGVLIFDREKLLYPGDFLHEAGHIAVCEPSRRPSLNGNVTGGVKGNEGEELAAMLWSYAACVELKIPPEIVFHENGYKGDSEWLIKNYSNKVFVGLPLLIWMKMTKDPKDGGFPLMLKWMR